MHVCTRTYTAATQERQFYHGLMSYSVMVLKLSMCVPGHFEKGQDKRKGVNPTKVI